MGSYDLPLWEVHWYDYDDQKHISCVRGVDATAVAKYMARTVINCAELESVHYIPEGVDQ